MPGHTTSASGVCVISSNILWPQGSASPAANEKGIRLKANPYEYKQAFKNSPHSLPTESLGLWYEVPTHTWDAVPSMLDPTVYGRSNPYEAIRHGPPTQTNYMNSVTAAIMGAGVETPTLYDNPAQADRSSQLGCCIR